MQAELARLAERVWGLDRLTDEKFVKLRTIVDSQADKAALALAAADKAVNKAESAINERLAGMNEIRASMGDQARTFIARTEAETRIAAIVEKVEANHAQVAIGDGKTDERLKVLERGSSNLAGRMWALGAGIAVVIAVVNVAIALLTR